MTTTPPASPPTNAPTPASPAAAAATAPTASADAARLLAGREVWFFAAVPWDFALHGRSLYLALGLRELGARITFVEPPSLKKTLRRLRHAPGAPADVTLVGMPPSIPKISDRLPLVPAVHDRLQREWLRLRLRACRQPPLAIVSTPRWVPALRGLPLEAVFYDCIDDLQVHAEPARLQAFEAWEHELIERARASFAVTPALADVLRARGAREVLVHRNGVGFDDFIRRAEPADAKGPRPRVGYLGALFEWVDLDLIARAAQALPDCEFALVGPVRRGIDVSPLARLPNVKLLGYRPYADVPKAMASFDVALIPFKEGAVARGADPIKIYEYFCFGTPVVTTPVSDVERIRDLLYIASGPEAFIDGIRAGLAERRPDLREARRAYARENDWSARARTMAEVLVGIPGSGARPASPPLGRLAP